MTILKGDVTNEAFTHLRIRGVVTDPTPEENRLALTLLEGFAEELRARNVRVGYAFEDDPDANTEAGFDRAYQSAFAMNLALRLIPAFNKQVPPDLNMMARGALSTLCSAAFRPNRTNWPTRAPVGSGNEWINRWRKFYPAACEAPDYPQTTMRHEEQIFGMRWYSELRGESIVASRWESDSSALVIENGGQFDAQETQVKVRRTGTERGEVVLTNIVDTDQRQGLVARLLVCLT